MRRVAGGLALLLVLSACTAESAPITTSTTAAPTTTSSVPPTTTTSPAPAETTTTLAVTTCGDYLEVQSLPWRVSVEGVAADVRLPRLVAHDWHSDINERLEAFVETRLAAALPDRGAYSLQFAALCLERDSWAMLSIVFSERTTPVGRAGTDLRFAFPFDLVNDDLLTAAVMFTEEGVTGLRALVHEQVAAVLGERFCCLAPEALVADLAVVPEGLLVYLDEADGIPHEVGPLEFLFPWSQVATLIDLRQPYLGSFAVQEGLCSTSGQEWVLEEQPGLPAAVAAKRAAVFAAAAACDYEALEDLAGDGEGFTGPIGNGMHPGTAEAFRDGEWFGDRTLLWLVQTLNLEWAEKTHTYSAWTGYVWPAAQDTLLVEIPEGQRAALEALYPRPLSEYGYRTGNLEPVFSGFHVTIAADGTWVWLGFNPA
jgi:hypothetical protein